MGHADEDDQGTDVTRVLPVVRRAGTNDVRYADSGRFPDSSWQRDLGQGDSALRGLGHGNAERRRRPDFGQYGTEQRGLAQRSLELHHLGWHPHAHDRGYPVIDWYARYGRYPDDEPGSGY